MTMVEYNDYCIINALTPNKMTFIVTDRDLIKIECFLVCSSETMKTHITWQQSVCLISVQEDFSDRMLSSELLSGINSLIISVNLKIKIKI